MWRYSWFFLSGLVSSDGGGQIHLILPEIILTPDLHPGRLLASLSFSSTVLFCFVSVCILVLLLYHLSLSFSLKSLPTTLQCPSCPFTVHVHTYRHCWLSSGVHARAAAMLLLLGSHLHSVNEVLSDDDLLLPISHC